MARMDIEQELITPPQNIHRTNRPSKKPSRGSAVTQPLLGQVNLLAPDTQAFGQGYIARKVISAYVSQQPSALAYQLKQAPARRFIVLVCTKVICKLVNPGGE
jgi:hypothetical protein